MKWAPEPKFDDNPFDSALDDLKKQIITEFSGETADLRKQADQILAKLKAIKDLKPKADAGQKDLAQKTTDVKDDLAAFEKRWGDTGEKIGSLIKSKVAGFLPLGGQAEPPVKGHMPAAPSGKAKKTDPKPIAGHREPPSKSPLKSASVSPKGKSGEVGKKGSEPSKSKHS